jgi:hypothetical protein
MIKEFSKAWAENEKRLEKKIGEDLEENEDVWCPWCYGDLLELVINEVINPYISGKLSTNSITTITTDGYQGTYIYIIPTDSWPMHPKNFVRTYVSYGSCCECDALLAATGVKDYKNLCLHLLQHMEYMDYAKQLEEGGK